MVTRLITWEKVLWKSKPCFWWKSLATNLALYLFIGPSVFSFSLSTHLPPMAFLFCGRGTRDHVSFFSRASDSLYIAESQLECWRVCFTILGSKTMRNMEGVRGDKWIPDFNQVCVGWMLCVWGKVEELECEGSELVDNCVGEIYVGVCVSCGIIGDVGSCMGESWVRDGVGEWDCKACVCICEFWAIDCVGEWDYKGETWKGKAHVIGCKVEVVRLKECKGMWLMLIDLKTILDGWALGEKDQFNET